MMTNRSVPENCLECPWCFETIHSLPAGILWQPAEAAWAFDLHRKECKERNE